MAGIGRHLGEQHGSLVPWKLPGIYEGDFTRTFSICGYGVSIGHLLQPGMASSCFQLSCRLSGSNGDLQTPQADVRIEGLSLSLSAK